jgi:cyclopropane fatty-acyl-phospholipid synthase-like methyltransferase
MVSCSKVAAVAAAFLWVAGTPQHTLAQSMSTHEHSFSGAEHWAAMFDDPARDAWQKPHEVIRTLGLAPNARVADIGSGTGYFSVRLAHFVPKGRVFGVDVEPDMIKYLAERAKREGLANVTSVTGASDDPKLPEKVDLVLMVDVIHHIADRASYLRKLRDELKPGGRVAIIDYSERSAMGPPAGERVAPGSLRSEMNAAGFALVKEHGFLPEQYFLVFQPRKS